MTKSVTVNFDDGTSHVYDNVPDDVSDEDVSARASTEFEGKTISGLGAGTTAANEVKPAPEPSMGEKAMAAAQTGLGVVQQALPVATTAAELYGLYKGGQLVNKYLDAKNTAQAVSQAPIGTPRGPATKIPVNWNPGATPTVPTSMNQLPVSARNIPVPTNPNLPTTNVNPNLPAVNRIDQIRAAANAPAPAPAPAVGGPAAQEGSNFIERIAQKYAPVAQRIAPILNNPVTRALTGPVGQVAQGMLYSPGLNTNEDEELRRRRAMAATIR